MSDYQKWHELHRGYDWDNEYKVKNNVESYLFRLNGYEQGKDNEFILKSTFGLLDLGEIEMQLKYWFNASIGAYNTIN